MDIAIALVVSIRIAPAGGRGHGHGGARLLPGVAGVCVPAAGRAGAQEVRAGGDAPRLRVRLVDLPPHGARRARRRRAARARSAAQDTEGNERSFRSVAIGATLHQPAVPCLIVCTSAGLSREGQR